MTTRYRGAKFLAWVHEGPCTDHPCDRCVFCRSGRCCRRDEPDYQFPELGDWPGVVFGQLGVLERYDNAVICHACGKEFVWLKNHIISRHNLMPAEYRAVFGLTQSASLTSLNHERRLAERMRDPRYRRGQDIIASQEFALTPEQLSHVNRVRPVRLQQHLHLVSNNAARVLPPKLCPGCGRVFHPDRSIRGACSRRCAQIARHQERNEAGRFISIATP